MPHEAYNSPMYQPHTQQAPFAQQYLMGHQGYEEFVPGMQHHDGSHQG
jgi:hypothetical protein